MDENKGPLSGKPPTAPQGPLRRAPRYYIGKTMGRRRVGGGRRHKGRTEMLGHTEGRLTVFADTARYPNGALGGIRDKGARRVIRAAFKRSHSSVEMQIRNARAMKAQAFE